MVASTGRPRPHANSFVRPRTASASSRPRWSTGTEAERLRRRTRSSVRVSAGLPIHSQSSPVACHQLTFSLSSLHVPNNVFKCQDRHTEHRCSGAAMERRPKGNLHCTNGWALSWLIGIRFRPLASPSHRIRHLCDAFARQLLAAVVDQVRDELQLHYRRVAQCSGHRPG